MDLLEALTRLEYITGFKPYKLGKVYLGICPCHEDNRPSLVIHEKDDKLLLHCYVRCSFVEILQSLTRNIPTPNKDKKVYDTTPFWELPIRATYTYLNEWGKPTYQKVRFEPKTFAIRHWVKGRFKWGMGQHEPILYNLPSVINNHSIFIVEGEKNVDTLKEWNLVATCNYDGAGKWLGDYNRYLFGKTVYIIPDNDQAGLEHAELIVQNIVKVARVKIVELPGLVNKQDIYDWIELGNTYTDLLKLL